MTRILESRWFYLALIGVVVLAYVRMLTLLPKPVPLTQEQEIAAAAPVPVQEFANMDISLAQILQGSQRHPVAARVFGWLLLVVGGLSVGGLCVTGRAVLHGGLREAMRYRSKLSANWSLADVGRITLLMILLVGLAPFLHLSLIAWGLAEVTDKHFWSVAFMLGLEAMFFFIVWGFASTKHLHLTSAFGINWRKTSRAMGHGLLGYMAVFPWVMGLLWLIGLVCQWLGVEPPVEPIHELLFLEQRPLMVALTLVLACVVGPIAEELFFRGLLFGAMRTRMSRVWASLATGSLFAAVHTNPVGFLPILLLGWLLADLYERTGSLAAPIAVHIVHNTLLISVGLTAKQILSS